MKEKDTPSPEQIKFDNETYQNEINFFLGDNAENHLSSEQILNLEKAKEEYFIEIEKENNKRIAANSLIFASIFATKGEEYLENVKACLKECEADMDLELVEKPENEPPQMEDWGSFNHIYVDQYCNGGMTGDSFAGYIYIPIEPNIYLKSHYAM